MKRIKKLIPLVFSFFIISSCSLNTNIVTSDASNYYKSKTGEIKDYHMKNWEYDNFDVFSDESDEEGGTKYKYQLTSGNAYSYIFTTMEGDFADFSYINVKAKGHIGHSIRLRVGLDFDYLENNFIGPDFDIALTEEYATYTLKVRNVYQTRLDVAKVMAILPDAGHTGPSYYSDFSLLDCWFSTAIPDDSTWVNTGVDSGEDSAQVINGWQSYMWTNYKIYPYNNEVEVYIEKAAEWALIEKEITIPEDVTSLNFNFINETYHGNVNSISRITFKLRGDLDYRVDTGVQYAYNVYHEQLIYNYRLGDENEVVADENGIIRLQIPIKSALYNLADHMTNGVRLALLIESDPTEKGALINPTDKYNYDGYGIMKIDSLSFSDGEVVFNPWTTENWTGYHIDTIDGKADITFSNASEWGAIITKADIEDADTLLFSLTSVNSSVTHISFGLRGDISGSDYTATGDFYYLYYEETIYNYERSAVSDDETVLIIPLTEALAALEGHYENGLSLCLLIESHPDYQDIYDGEGELIINSFEFVKGE